MELTLHSVREPDGRAAGRGARSSGTATGVRATRTLRAGQSARAGAGVERPTGRRADVGPRRSQRLERRHGDFWRDWIAQSTYTRPLARDGAAVGDHAQADDLRADRRAGRRADGRAARAGRRRAQLGLPLHLGPRRARSRSTRCSASGYARRPGRSAAGCATAVASGRRATAGPLNIMYRVDGSLRPDRGDASTTSRATAARGRCGSATAPPTSCSSTSTARRSTPSTSPTATACRCTTEGWTGGLAASSTGCATTGTSPTRASGRPAAGARTSPTAG